MVSNATIPLEQALNQRVLMLNASTANPAWDGLPETAWGGPQFVGSPNLNVTRPDLVLEWSIELLAAGADILETRSFGADAFTAAAYGADRSQRRGVDSGSSRDRPGSERRAEGLSRCGWPLV